MTALPEVFSEFQKEFNVDFGTPSSFVRDQLPKTIQVVDNDGGLTNITGTWKSAGFKPETPGVYFFTFSPSQSLPPTLQDVYELIKVKEKEKKENKGGCSGSLGASCLTISLATLGASILIRKKKEK